MRRNQGGAGLALAAAGIAGAVWLFTRGKKRGGRATGWWVAPDCGEARLESYTAAEDDMQAYATARGWGVAESRDEIVQRLHEYFDARFPQCDGKSPRIDHPELGNVNIGQWADALWEVLQRVLNQQDAGAPIVGEGITGLQ